MARGILYIVGTPIGNLADLSPRAAEVIRTSHLLLCEDTRVTRKLLAHLGADTPLESFHEYSEGSKMESALSRIEQGESLGLVSDAGMPLLSDPGFPLVREAASRGLRIEVIPGPFAASVALVASGIAPAPFAFLGFLPRRASERRAVFARLPDLAMTAVFYESPHRILATLEDLVSIAPEAEIAICRELTKLHEEVVRGIVPMVKADLEKRESIRGEIVLVVGPVAREEKTATPDQIREEFVRLRDSGMRRTDAVKVLAERFSLSRRELYDMLSD